MSRDPIRNELRGLDSWLTREPFDDREPTALDELGDYLDGLAQSGHLVPIDDAPKDGTEFKAVLAETGETVTVFYREAYRLYLSEDRAGTRAWGREDFAGQLLTLPSS